MQKLGFLGGQSPTATHHAGPSFSPGPLHPTQHLPNLDFPTLPPRPTTAPTLPPAIIPAEGFELPHTPPPPASNPHTTCPTTTGTPVNISKYRLSLFTRAKNKATEFLGKFMFGANILTEVLPPIRHETITPRDERYNISTGKIYWKDHYNM